MTEAEIVNLNQRIVNALRVNLNGADDIHDVTRLVDDLTKLALRAAELESELADLRELRKEDLDY